MGTSKAESAKVIASWWEGGGSASHAVRTPLLGLCSDRGTDCDRIECLFCSHDALIRKP